MQSVVVTISETGELESIFEEGERLLWSGAPDYGRKIFESVGDERVTHIAVLVGVFVMWATLPFIDAQAGLGWNAAVWVFAAVTLVFAAFSCFLADQRRYVLRNLAYFVTDRRVVICRRGRNWRFRVQLYIVSCGHSENFPYAVIETRPFGSVLVGTLLSVDQVQPFGHGLSHPGHAIFRNRVTSEITLDYLDDAQEVLEIIQSNLRAN